MKTDQGAVSWLAFSFQKFTIMILGGKGHYQKKQKLLITIANKKGFSAQAIKGLGWPVDFYCFCKFLSCDLLDALEGTRFQKTNDCLSLKR